MVRHLVPALTHTLPWLVPLAALGLAIVTISASVYHLRRGEPPISAVVAALALVIVLPALAGRPFQLVIHTTVGGR